MQPLIDARRAELRADFSYNDRNDDGRIDFDEFCDLLENLETGMSKSAARIGFHEIDANHDGVIDFDEFAEWWGSGR